MGKQKRTPEGSPADAQKWIEEYRRGEHQGLSPTPAHSTSIWDTTYIPERYAPATSELIAEAEERLQVAIPDSLKTNLLIQNGGCLPDCDPFPFEEVARWTNAVVDGIMHVEDWERACDDHWFDSVADVDRLELLIRIAAHSESQLCLDYRTCGPTGKPAVTYVDVCMSPTEVIVVVSSIDEFVRALVSARHRVKMPDNSADGTG